MRATRLAAKWRLRRALATTGVVLAAACSAERAPDPPNAGDVWFEEVARTAGVVFKRTWADYQTVGGRLAGGVCVLDADQDGQLDIFMPGPSGPGQAGSHLYMQRGPFAYVDEAAARGLADVGGGSGCLAFDVDGDREIDLLTTGIGGVRLFHNQGGRFTEISSNIPTDAFKPDDLATAAVAFDADGDGDLDLAVASYGHFVPPGPSESCADPCRAQNTRYFGGTTHLFLQQPGGAFQDATGRLGGLIAPGLVLLATDLDEDGKPDLFVGNDIREFRDFYFKGNGVGFFREVANDIGVSVSAAGSGICSMSATEGDIDGDGHLDLAESSYEDEPSVVFRCAGSQSYGSCSDVGESLEMFRGPRNLRWGQVLADFDDDGLPELFEAVGHYFAPEDTKDNPFVKPFPAEAAPVMWHRNSYQSPLALVPPVVGLAEKTGGRGVVAADLDGDGALDVVVGTAYGRPLIMRNVRPVRGQSINIQLRGKGMNTQGIGARITARSGSRSWPAIVHAGSGFLSSDGARVHIGLGDLGVLDAIDVAWPSGKRSHLTNVAAQRLLTISEP